MKNSPNWLNHRFSVLGHMALAAMTVFWTGCNPGAPVGNQPDGPDNETPDTDGENTLLDDPISNDGTLNGKVIDSQSTRASTTNTSAAQTLPLEVDPDTTVVEFQDLAGNPIVDGSGEPLDEVPLNPDGTFTADNLPVGVDFTICVDIGSDGTCDLKTYTNIPASGSDGSGDLDDEQVDPLTTLAFAKLEELIAEQGLDRGDIPISPSALIKRIIEAYTHLFEDSGLEAEVTLDDLENLTDEQLAELFDEVIPALVKVSMQTAEGNLGLAIAEDVEAAALAAAKVFLHAGFPIADQPQGLDLSSLADEEGVETLTMEQLMHQGDPLNEEFIEADEGLETVQPAQFEGPANIVVYRSTVSEADRNFSEEESEDDGSDGPKSHLPVIHDYLLQSMANLQLQNRRLTLGQLYDLLTSLDEGLGARLTYFVFDPHFFGPPLNIFETTDQRGKAIDLKVIFGRIFADGFQQLTHEQLQARDAELRRLLAELLDGTSQPTLERLAGAFLTDRVESVQALTDAIRDARTHLPFSRTGPATFYVVADGDPFLSDSVSAITVDADVTRDGEVTSVTMNSSGAGKFYLQFTEATEGRGIVGLMVRETGRLLHARRGLVRLDMNDATIFQPVDGRPFIDVVAQTGNFFPGVNLTVVSSDFVPVAPAPRPPDGTASAQALTDSGPTHRIFVLATEPGPESEPVRVDYDPTTGTATYNPGGRNVLQFLPDTQETGVFLLFNEQTGRPAGQEDPADFFAPPPPRPDGYEEVYNNLEDFESIGTVEDIDAIVDGFLTTGEIPVITDGSTTDPNVAPAQVDGSAPVDVDATVPTEPISMAPFAGEVNAQGQILIGLDAVVGLPLERQNFTHVFGTDVENPRYNADGDPYFDDINADGIQDSDEPTAPHRPTLFNPSDWRSTDIRLYYRRSDNNAGVTFEEVDFASETPKTLDGVDLVARNYLARLNAFRFARPNTAMNLLTAFLPPEFFDGAHALNTDTSLDIFGAIAILNLMMDQVHTVEAIVDPDGLGPLPTSTTLIDAHVFVPPIGDPFVLLLRGFEVQSAVVEPAN